MHSLLWSSLGQQHMRWILVTSSSCFVEECVVLTRALPTCSYARTRFNRVTLTQIVETQTLLLGSRGPLLQAPALEGVTLIDPVGSIAGWTGIWGCFSDVKDGWSAPLELTSNDAVHLTLVTYFGGGGETVTIVAQVVDCITPDYPPQDLRAIKDLPFLRDLSLADPDFGSSGRVDLLLGIVDSNKCTLDESVSSPDRSIRAWNTLFGWAIGGETGA